MRYTSSNIDNFSVCHSQVAADRAGITAIGWIFSSSRSDSCVGQKHDDSTFACVETGESQEIQTN